MLSYNQMKLIEITKIKRVTEIKSTRGQLSYLRRKLENILIEGNERLKFDPYWVREVDGDPDYFAEWEVKDLFSYVSEYEDDDRKKMLKIARLGQARDRIIKMIGEREFKIIKEKI